MLSLAICLAAYGLVAAVFAPVALARWTGSGSAPRFELAAWLVAMLTVLGSWAAAAALLVAQTATLSGGSAQVVNACVATVSAAAVGAHGAMIQLGLLTLAVLVVVTLLIGAARVAQNLLRGRRLTHEHALTARLIGQPMPDGTTVLLDTTQQLVYCVPGRPGTIVVTRPARDLLTDAQLRAVLAHERAHLRGRHHTWVALTRALALLLPRMTLFTAGARAVGRLTELCADDAAVRSCDRRHVFDALLRLGTSAPVGPGILAATGGSVTARLARLLEPPSRAQRLHHQLTLAVVLTALILAPIAVTVLATGGLAGCGSTLT
ncbi:M56 family metallopeptidase [Segeticoccus rhizosphaerae]|uniref:M56 family metallopeptidase n=1 Tax=Segeticoccus rhizosphaerae TaxID=1104777 RepID=UPI0010BFF92C|nr:M56 family metallopeptidase [Ornithinicoccus soli]